MRVGIIGTGFAARLRAEAVREDGRAQLVGVAGHTFHQVRQFAQEFATDPFSDPSALLQEALPALVFVSIVNRDHAVLAQAALEMGCHVVVEYPLAFRLQEAEQLVELARIRQRLLHVEHIELLSGVHLLLQQELPSLGGLFTVNYATLTTNRPAPDRWTYRPELFGFPLIGAVSRIHRLVDLFGPVQAVSCQLRYDGPELPERFHSCICYAQLVFASGLIGTLSYGKGEAIWRPQRTIEVQGGKGALLIDGEQAVLIRADGAHAVDVGSRRGLFVQDTHMVLDHLFEQKPLYVSQDVVLHSLAVGVATEIAAETGQVIKLDDLERLKTMHDQLQSGSV